MEHNQKVCTRRMSRFTVILLVVTTMLGACAQIGDMRASPESAAISREKIAAIVASRERRPADPPTTNAASPNKSWNSLAYGQATGLHRLIEKGETVRSCLSDELG